MKVSNELIYANEDTIFYRRNMENKIVTIDSIVATSKVIVYLNNHILLVDPRSRYDVINVDSLISRKSIHLEKSTRPNVAVIMADDLIFDSRDSLVCLGRPLRNYSREFRNTYELATKTGHILDNPYIGMYCNKLIIEGREYKRFYSSLHNLNEELNIGFIYLDDELIIMIFPKGGKSNVWWKSVPSKTILDMGIDTFVNIVNGRYPDMIRSLYTYVIATMGDVTKNSITRPRRFEYGQFGMFFDCDTYPVCTPNFVHFGNYTTSSIEVIKSGYIDGNLFVTPTDKDNYSIAIFSKIYVNGNIAVFVSTILNIDNITTKDIFFNNCKLGDQPMLFELFYNKGVLDGRSFRKHLFIKDDNPELQVFITKVGFISIEGTFPIELFQEKFPNYMEVEDVKNIMSGG